MQAKEIDNCLRQLGQELSNQGIHQPIRVLVIGGTFMLTQVGNRSITEDIDVIFLEILIGEHRQSIRLPCRRQKPLLSNIVLEKTGSMTA